MVCHGRFAGFCIKHIGCSPGAPVMHNVGAAVNATGAGLRTCGHDRHASWDLSTVNKALIVELKGVFRA
jgi:hypothetical protein